MNNIIDSVNWEKSELIPVIAQDYETHEVLMLAYVNKEALALTIAQKTAHYFSRSKQRIWQKGETSGNIQKIKDIFIDCDNDTLLLKVEQVGGAACHTGRKSCFFTNVLTNEVDSEIDTNVTDNYSVSDRLYHVIQERKVADPSSSYVASLLHKGDNAILKKVVEEAGEFCFAVKDKDEKEIIYEAADLAFHVLVALGDNDINPDRIKQELARRFGMSGIEEKNSRKQTDVTKPKTEAD
ncbi:MAG: bifunctional phosphoribosyl-AMP cyclohydrolase/phosphoribosyl-ATP diphosphatase HisIE [Epsilonproteobacteria bacterium]|nr:bifunctional phosphoribosyl-AMP cyclohydrolase/phosphoribosyl-ATP diphosphatase HisIE [Campylobacterota bacterium]